MIPLVACIYNYLKLSLQHSKQCSMFLQVASFALPHSIVNDKKGDDTKRSRWTQVVLAYIDKIYIKSWTCEKWLKEKDGMWTKSWWRALQQMATSFDSSLPLIVLVSKCLLVILKSKFEMNVVNVIVHIIMVIILNQP